LNTCRCVKINSINLNVFEDQPANCNCSKAFPESTQFNEGIKFALGKETRSNSPLPKWKFRGKKLSFLATYSEPKCTPKRNLIPKCSKIRSNAKRQATFLWMLAH
jgi:hypothetical protein